MTLSVRSADLTHNVIPEMTYNVLLDVKPYYSYIVLCLFLCAVNDVHLLEFYSVI